MWIHLHAGGHRSDHQKVMVTVIMVIENTRVYIRMTLKGKSRFCFFCDPCERVLQTMTQLGIENPTYAKVWLKEEASGFYLVEEATFSWIRKYFQVTTALARHRIPNPPQSGRYNATFALWTLVRSISTRRSKRAFLLLTPKWQGISGISRTIGAFMGTFYWQLGCRYDTERMLPGHRTTWINYLLRAQALQGSPNALRLLPKGMRVSTLVNRMCRSISYLLDVPNRFEYATATGKRELRYPYVKPRGLDVRVKELRAPKRCRSENAYTENASTKNASTECKRKRVLHGDFLRVWEKTGIPLAVARLINEDGRLSEKEVKAKLGLRN